MTRAAEGSPRSAQLQLLWVMVVTFGSLVISAVGLLARTPPATSSRTAADAPCPEGPALETVPGAALDATVVAIADAPTWFASHPHLSGTGVVTERRGRVLAVRDGRITGDVLLDLSDDTATKGDGGLLSAVYDPDGRWLYLLRALSSRDDELTAHALDAQGRPETGPGRVLLHIPHGRSLQHHGGSLVMLPGGDLLIGTGDGGGLGDPRENAQDRRALLGKLLRIHPTPGEQQAYTIPAGNPFVGDHGWRAEVWALGLRNPYRASVDLERDEIWVGDVGQSCWEELNRLSLGGGGANLQWDRREGPAAFEGGDVALGRSTGPAVAIPHRGGFCAIVAGYVVHDPGSPLDARLLVSDYCASRILSLDPADPSGPPQHHEVARELSAVTAIVPGPAGWPWVLSLDGPIVEVRPRSA